MTRTLSRLVSETTLPLINRLSKLIIDMIQLKSGEAPIASGRSGFRSERGLHTSGLLHEKLNLSADPKFNSFVQRSWLPHDDPSLNYRYLSSFKSNTIKSDDDEREEYEDLVTSPKFGRRAVITGNPLNPYLGIFYDETILNPTEKKYHS
jgi:hypothetical protein